MRTNESTTEMDRPAETALMVEIGQRVRALREYAAQTQQEFADLIGCSRRQVAKIEDGQAVPSIWNLKTLRQTHGVDPEWILSGPQSEPMAHSFSQDWERYDRLVAEVREMALSRGVEMPEQRAHEYARISFEKAPTQEREAMAIIERVIVSTIRTL
jgi:transcriptional regulator with XRE-family HTH domain